MNEEIEVADSSPDKDARLWAMLCHLAALAGIFSYIGFGVVLPFANVLGPLIIWLIKRNESSFVDDQGSEALNFHLTMTIAFVISVMLMFILIGFIFIMLFIVYDLVMTIIAAVKANDGNKYRYPYIIRFIK